MPADFPRLQAPVGVGFATIVRFTTGRFGSLVGKDRRPGVCNSQGSPAMHNALPNHETPHALEDMLEEAALDAAALARMQEIAVRSTQLAEAFAQNVRAASGDWTKHVTDETALQGMPPRGKRLARLSAQQQQLPGFLLTLDTESCALAWQHLDDRKLRREVYEAYVTRASDHGPRAGRFDNTPLVHETLRLRHELSQLMGLQNYAELALRHALLHSPDDVERYLLRGAAEARTRAQAELDAVWAFAKAQGVPKGFSTWDLDYYARWFRREQLGFSDEELPSYFPIDAVLAGWFALSERLLGARAVPRAGAPETYALLAGDGDEIGRIELETQRPDAGLPVQRVSVYCVSGEPLQEPVHFDLGTPLDDDDGPVLLTHAQVCALFRCLGTAVFALLARASAASEPALRPASLLAGAYFEQFCFHFESLAAFARHRVTGASLPRELFDQLIASRDFHAGLARTQELELALFDLRVHRDYVPMEKATQLRAHVLDTLAQVRREICVLRPPFWERFANTCSAMFVHADAARIWELTWAKHIASALFAQLEASGFAHDTLQRQRDAFWFASDRGLLDRLSDVLGSALTRLP